MYFGVGGTSGGTTPIVLDTFDNNEGDMLSSAAGPMFWESYFRTKDETLISACTGDHQDTQDNSIREWNPNTGTETQVRANDNGASGFSQYDNQWSFYSKTLDKYIMPSRFAWDRASSTLTHGLRTVAAGGSDTWNSPNGRICDTASTALIYPYGSWQTDTAGLRAMFEGDFNPHAAYSETHDCFVRIGGGSGGASTNSDIRQLWVGVPGSNFGASQPYACYYQTMPATVGGVQPFKLRGRDGCCFAGDYVYWVGGSEFVSTTLTATKHFFRMKITPHITSDTASLTTGDGAIERLDDIPQAMEYPLLRYDPYVGALLCIGNTGIFAYDINNPSNSWTSDLTPSGYLADYLSSADMPVGVMGDYIDTKSGTVHRKFFWRPGNPGQWATDSTTRPTERTLRVRSIKLARS